MQDKYSKIEDVVKKNLSRKVFLDELVEKHFKDILEYLTWEITGQKQGKKGERLNLFKITCKKSSVKFFVNSKINDFKKEFEEKFKEGVLIKVE